MDFITTSKANHPVVYVDVETGGLNPNSDALLSIGAVCGGNVFYQLVKTPHGDIHREALAVNGLSLDVCAENGLPLPIVLQGFFNFVNACRHTVPRPANGLNVGAPVMGGYNTQFDFRFIEQACHRVSMANLLPVSLWYKHIDVFSMSLALQNTAQTGGGLDSLEKLYFRCFGEKMPKAHNALEDAQHTRECAQYLSSRFTVSPVATLHNPMVEDWT